MRISDWSSDVCSSDLAQQLGRGSAHVDRRHGPAAGVDVLGLDAQIAGEILADDAGIAHLLDLLDLLAEGEALEHLVIEIAREAGRSEERRVGKECVSTFRSRWAP